LAVSAKVLRLARMEFGCAFGRRVDGTADERVAEREKDRLGAANETEEGADRTVRSAEEGTKAAVGRVVARLEALRAPRRPERIIIVREGERGRAK